MPFPLTPPHRILERMLQIAIDAEIHVPFGVAKPFNFRHHRHRYAKAHERPSISLRMIAPEINPDFEAIHTMSEVCWKMTVDIIVDLDLAPEGAGIDETGWNQLFAIANAVTKLYVAEDSEIRLMIDDVLYGDVDPDEDCTPDNGRLAQSVVVLYRTLWNDPNHLLSSEDNGL